MRTSYFISQCGDCLRQRLELVPEGACRRRDGRGLRMSKESEGDKYSEERHGVFQSVHRKVTKCPALFHFVRIYPICG